MLVPIDASQGDLKSARVDLVETAGPADGGDGLVNEQVFEVRLVLAAVAADMADPARVVNQGLERQAA